MSYNQIKLNMKDVKIDIYIYIVCIVYISIYMGEKLNRNIITENLSKCLKESFIRSF